MPCVEFLPLDGVIWTLPFCCFSFIDSVDFVKGNNKRSFPHFEKFNGFKSLFLNPTMNINYENSYVAETASSGPEITESFMTRSIDNKKILYLNLNWVKVLYFLDFLENTFPGDQCSPNLLCYSSGLISLNTCMSYWIEDLSFTYIDMPENTADWCSHCWFCKNNTFDFHIQPFLHFQIILLFFQTFFLFLA